MYKQILLLFLLFLIQSCSNTNKLNKKANSNFLAYYNTFYMSEKYYNEALEIIKLSQTNIISKEAETLLNKAIENALLNTQKSYENNLVDDIHKRLNI